MTDITRRLCLYCRSRRALRRFGYGACSLTCVHKLTGYNRETARINAERRNRERARDEFIKEMVRFIKEMVPADTSEAVAEFNGKYQAALRAASEPESVTETTTHLDKSDGVLPSDANRCTDHLPTEPS